MFGCLWQYLNRCFIGATTPNPWTNWSSVLWSLMNSCYVHHSPRYTCVCPLVCTALVVAPATKHNQLNLYLRLKCMVLLRLQTNSVSLSWCLWERGLECLSLNRRVLLGHFHNAVVSHKFNCLQTVSMPQHLFVPISKRWNIRLPAVCEWWAWRQIIIGKLIFQ